MLYLSNYLLLWPLHPYPNAHIDIHRKYSIAAIKERNDSIQTKSWKCWCVYELFHKGISIRSLTCFDCFEAGKKSLERETCPGGAKIHLYLCVVTDKNKSHLCRQHIYISDTHAERLMLLFMEHISHSNSPTS